jgi:predicted RNA-binding Zn ribbon-like protein
MTLFDGLQLVGGHLALDFVNTVEYRAQPEPGDRLTSFGALARWSVAAGLISQAESANLFASGFTRAPRAARAFRSAIGLREALYAVVVARIHGTTCPHGARRVVERRLRIARAAAQLEYDAGKAAYFWHIPIRGTQDVANRLAESANDLLLSLGRVAVRQCGGPKCDWLFVDRSHGGRRLWCQPAKCGNIVRVRRSRAR